MILVSKMKETVFQHKFIERKHSLFRHFNRFTPMNNKIDLVQCLIHRAFKVSSSYIIFHNDLEKIKVLLQKNMYRKIDNTVIDNQIKTFLGKQFTVDSGATL